MATLTAALLTLLILAPAPVKAQTGNANCSASPTGLTPLTDLGTDTYQGNPGGLYPGGANEVPPAHLALGLGAAAGITPRDPSGTPDPDGVIGLLGVGVSNTRDEFRRFSAVLAETETGRVVPINGAQGGRALEQWADPNDRSIQRSVDAALAAGGVAGPQVQAAWIKLPSQNRGTVDLADAPAEITLMGEVLRDLKTRYPNLAIAYISSRSYAGYSGGEPGAYQHGFTVKWLIEAQIEGAADLNADPSQGQVVAPWLAWGPYIWADGSQPREDGLSWQCDDYDNDGIHPGEGLASGVAELLVDHFSTHPTAAPWFLGLDTLPPPSTTVPSTTIPSTATTPSTTTTIPSTITIPSTTLAPPTPPSTPPAPPGPGPDAAGPDATEGFDLAWLLGGVAVGAVGAVGLISLLSRRPERSAQ